VTFADDCNLIDLDSVYGGYSNGPELSATGNKVLISGGEITGIETGMRIYGGASVECYSGNAASNMVAITGGTLTNVSYIEGGYCYEGDELSATDNKVLISGGTLVNAQYIYGGAGYEANDNLVVICGTATMSTDGLVITPDVYGGYGSNEAIGNTVQISTTTGSTTVGNVYGSLASITIGNTLIIADKNVTATTVDMFSTYGFCVPDSGENEDTLLDNGNTIDFAGKTIYVTPNYNLSSGDTIVLAAKASSSTPFNYYYELAEGNSMTGGTVAIDNNNLVFTMGTIDKWTSVQPASPTNNVVIVNSGTTATVNGKVQTVVDGDGWSNVYGGYSTVPGAYVAFNTVKLDGNTNLVGTNIYGGYSSKGTVANNTLEVTGKDISVKSLNGFQNYNFILTSNIAEGDTVLTVGDPLTIEDESSIFINTKNSALAKGQKFNLIADDAGICMDKDNVTITSTDGITWETADLTLAEGNKKLVYTQIKNGLVPDGAKAPVEGMAAAAGVVNTTADIVTGAGMANMIASTATTSGTEPFAAASFGKGRLETGSHVDTKGYGIVVGVGKKVFDKAGNKTTGGLFFEYGNSDFDTYNNAVTGSGKSINKGGGYMMRWDNKSGNYYEGMIHAGKITSNWSNSMGGYNMSPTYFGGALTYGHKFMVGEDKQLSVYGSYIYSRTGGGDAKIGNHDFSIEATKSHRTKVGVRYAASDLMDTKKFRPYIGLAWEHEFNGETAATVRNFGAAPTPSMKGDSGILEFGCKQEAGKWTLGIGAEVFAGKRRGWNGMLQAVYNF